MQIVSITPVNPLLMFEIPIWHHHHSFKLLIDNTNSVKGNSLILKSNVVKVTIQRSSEKGWQVDYEIKHAYSSFSTGRVWMSENDLRTAFKLSENCGADFGQAVLDQYGGDVAYQGRYIRYGRYLNIPGPGTGNDGDPNVSIYLTDEVIAVVAKFFQ